MLLLYPLSRTTAPVCVPIPFPINLPAKTGVTISINRLRELVLIQVENLRPCTSSSVPHTELVLLWAWSNHTRPSLFFCPTQSDSTCDLVAGFNVWRPTLHAWGSPGWTGIFLPHQVRLGLRLRSLPPTSPPVHSIDLGPALRPWL
jgi:hypothetical protein